jgi:hypothetical protein
MHNHAQLRVSSLVPSLLTCIVLHAGVEGVWWGVPAETHQLYDSFSLYNNAPRKLHLNLTCDQKEKRFV